MVATKESKELAERLLADTIAQQDIERDQLTIHADRGSSMPSTPVAFLLADLGVTKSHSRPHTSNDNPFSEAQSKTLKYRPDLPDTSRSRAVAIRSRTPRFGPGVAAGVTGPCRRWSGALDRRGIGFGAEPDGGGRTEAG